MTSQKHFNTYKEELDLEILRHSPITLVKKSEVKKLEILFCKIKQKSEI